MNKFDKTRNSNQQYDMISLFQSAQERTMRHLHVSSLAKVKAVNGTNVTAMLFPKRKGTETIEINAYNLFNSAINVGDIILVVFTDRDFNGNLATIGDDSVAETGDDDLHSFGNAVAIEITPFSESELKLKTIDYQSIKGEGNIDLSLTYALKSNLENNYYTKSEINERLADDFYTKGEIDSKLNGKQNKATPLGNNITPVYIDSNGDFALCASYTNASVKHADSANNANSAEYSESATYATYLGEDGSTLQYSANDIKNGFNSKQDRVTALGNITTPVYVSKDGVLSACTPYSEAQVSYASEANYAINASSANSSTFSNRLAKATDSGTYYTYENINESFASLDGRITQNTNSLSSLKNVVNGTISYSVDLVEE